MKRLHFIPPYLRNKYVLTLLAFGAWMVFFDKDDLLVQRHRANELQALQESKVNFQQEIEKERKFSQELRTNPAIIEKFAREKYGMKRDDEDLFIVQPTADGKKGKDVAQ